MASKASIICQNHFLHLRHLYPHSGPNVFQKLLPQIMSQEPKPILSEEEIHFDVLGMQVMEMGGEKWVVWLN